MSGITDNNIDENDTGLPIQTALSSKELDLAVKNAKSFLNSCNLNMK